MKLSADVEDMELSVGAGEMIYEGAIRRSVEAECAMGTIEITFKNGGTEHES